MNNKITAYWLFLVSPVYSVIFSLRKFRESWAKNVIWIFVAFFGYTFFVSELMDSSRYREGLLLLHSSNINQFKDFLSMIYDNQTGYVDILEPVLTFLVSRFTDDPRILFAIFGSVFGYFYSRNLWFLLSRTNERLRSEALPFIIMSAFMIAVWQLNGFRFWTAAHIFIFGVYTLYLKRSSYGLIYAGCALFVHFSFMLPFLLLLVNIFVGSKLLLAMGLYFVSFFVNELNPSAFQGYASYVPDVFVNRAAGYTKKEYQRRIAKTYDYANWYVTFRYTALRYSINLILLVLLLKWRKELSRDKANLALLCFALIMSAGTNLLSSVHSMGRFHAVSDVLLFGSLFLFIQSSQLRVLPKIVWIGFIFAAALFLAVEFRIGLDTITLLTVLGNPIVAPFLPNDFPLIRLFK